MRFVCNKEAKAEYASLFESSLNTTSYEHAIHGRVKKNIYIV